MMSYQTHDKNIGEAKLEASSCARESGSPVLPLQDVRVKPEDGPNEGDYDGYHDGDDEGYHDRDGDDHQDDDGELQNNCRTISPPLIC